MPENISALKSLLIEEMQSLLHAEHQLVKSMPKLAKGAQSAPVREAIHAHLEQTRAQVDRLQEAFELLGAKAKARTCQGMQGLIEEAEDAVSRGREMDAAAADVAIIIATQKIEHYEISGYGSLRALAERVGESRVARLLADTEAEEARADAQLTEISQPLLARAA